MVDWPRSHGMPTAATVLIVVAMQLLVIAATATYSMGQFDWPNRGE